MNIYEQALQRLKINQMAEKTRMGGEWTPQGLQEADKMSDLNGHDLALLQNMTQQHGLLGSLTDV